MTKKEREYLRSAYLSLQNKITGYPTTSIIEANKSSNAGSVLKEAVFLVLTMDGDGEYAEELLDELFEVNNIDYLALNEE